MSAPGSPSLTALRTSQPEMSMGRRAAIGTSMASMVATTAVLPAFADSTEDAMAAIAAKNKAKLVADKAAMKEKFVKEGDDSEKANAIAPFLVGGVGAASLVFSFPFFYKNVARLGLKFASVVNKDIKESDYKR